MLLVWLIIALVAALAGAGFFLGAPYLPTLKRPIENALDLAGIKSGQTLIDLGSGDGRIMLAAAKRGVKVIGFEINPLLVIVSRYRLRRYHDAQIIWGNYWRHKWPEPVVFFVFLLGKYMTKLDSRLSGYQHKPVKLVDRK